MSETSEADAGAQDDIEETGQIQAFGLDDLGEGYPEMGYISIVELIGANVELDLYFESQRPFVII